MYGVAPYSHGYGRYGDVWSTLTEAGEWLVEHKDEIETGLETAGEVQDLVQQAQGEADAAAAEADAAAADTKALKTATNIAKRKEKQAKRRAAAKRARQRQLKREAAAQSSAAVPFFQQPKVWWSVAGAVGVISVITAMRRKP